MLKMLDLFSGIGGFSLAASWTGQIETVAFCEIEPYCQKVLHKHWPDVPIFSDIKELRGENVGTVDIVCGGFPCQPFSCAGKRRGKEDDRYLWPEMFRVIQETKPAWIVGENVAGFVNMGLDDCISNLESEGYEVQPIIIPAAAVNAPHRRDRVWIISYAGGKQADQQLLRPAKFSRQPRKSLGTREEATRQENGAPSNDNTTRLCEIFIAPNTNNTQGEGHGSNSGEILSFSESKGFNTICGHVPYTNCKGLQTFRFQGRLRETEGKTCSSTERGSLLGSEWATDWWEFEPDVGRVAHGIPHRVDRLRGLGNAIVPQVAYQIFRAIVDIEAGHNA